MATPVLTVLEEDKHAWFAGRTRAILKYLDAEVGPPVPGKIRKILDIGSGAGNMAHHLAQYGQVFGLDYNPRPLPVAQQRGLPVMQGGGNELPFLANTFDLLALLDTVEHIPDELGVLYECQRVLKPGGKLIVTVPAFMWLWSYNDEINAHQRRYTAPELQQKLELCGLHVKRISYNNFFLFPAIAAIRVLRPYNPGLKSPHLDQEPDVYQVDMEPIPEPANTVLHGVGWLEAEILQRGYLPFGTSVIAIAEKAA
jgi:SAM-dependent methyltransferase